MEQAYIYDGVFLDSRTIQLSEESRVSDKEVRLVIIPKKTFGPKRKAGLLKGKIRIHKDFDAPLEELRDDMK